MPQEFQVVRCSACNIFQVQIKKKSMKWQCKICNEKQALNKVYAESDSTECRRHVQKLNMQQAKIEREPKNMDSSSQLDSEEEDEVKDGQTTARSKWDIFIDSGPSSSDSEAEIENKNQKYDQEEQDLLQSDIDSTSCKDITPKPKPNHTSIPSFINICNNVTVDELDSLFEL